MAISLRGLLRSNFKLFNANILSPVSYNVTRSIYSPEALSMDSYINSRATIATQFQTVSETFRAKMNEFTNDENKSLIFTEDLKAMLHIVDNNPEDINLMTKMLEKYSAQNNELRFGNYVFGPVVMRTYYYLDMPDLAYEMFKSSKMNGFFDQLTSYQILLCLLYKHNKYAEVREVYDIIKSKSTAQLVHPHNSVVTVLASCFKENTPESFEYAINLWSDLNRKGYDPSRKTVCLVSMLSIKQGKPEFALEFMWNFPRYRHIDLRCTKLEALIALKRFSDISQFLSKCLQNEKFDAKPLTFFKDPIDHLIKAIEEDPSGKEEIAKLIDEMKARNLVQDLTLEDSILSPIEKKDRTDKAENDTVKGFRRNYKDFKARSRFSIRR